VHHNREGVTRELLAAHLPRVHHNVHAGAAGRQVGMVDLGVIQSAGFGLACHVLHACITSYTLVMQDAKVAGLSAARCYCGSYSAANIRSCMSCMARCE
jgi:hypothetical protein